MTTSATLAPLLERFFMQRLMQQRQASPHTISSYRDTFRQFLKFVQQRLHKPPTRLNLEDIDAPLIVAFLDELEKHQGVSVRTRNLRLAAIHSFFHYAALETPAHSAQIQSVLAIPSKRFERPLLGYLSLEELQAIVQAPPQGTWSGRRDRLLFALLYATGARVSEIVALNQQDLHWQEGTWLCLHGKGRKERQVPLLNALAHQLKVWLKEQPQQPTAALFTNARGQRLTRFGVNHRLLLTVQQARQNCPALQDRSISPHTFRHTCAMHLLQAGVDLASIALLLGHASSSTTHLYVEADLKMKRTTLEKLPLLNLKPGTFKPTDQVLAFLATL